MIAFLGPKGTFGHEVTERYFSIEEAASEGLACSDNRAVVRTVAEGRAAYGVVPIENSTEGPVGMTLTAIYQAWEEGHSVYPFGTLVLPVAHCLLGLPGASLKDIRELRSHPQAHGQCQRFIQSNVSSAVFGPTSSTAGAAKLVRDTGDPGVATIASQRAGELYGLHALATNIQDRADNRTRFLILSGKSDHEATGDDKTLLAFTCEPDRPGSLVKVLQPLADAGVNVHMVVSLQHDLGSYLFYLGFAGHRKDQKIERVLQAMTNQSQTLHVFGSYPAAK